MPKCLRERRYSTREQSPVSWRTSLVMCFVVERYSGCRASSLFFRSKPKYSTIPMSRSGRYCKSASNRDLGSRRRGSLIYTSFCRYGLSEDHIATTPLDINRFRIAALSLDDYAAGLAYMAGLARWAISLRSVQGLPAVPGLKKVTADASGFVALTPEGMAGTSLGPAGGRS